MFAGTKVMHLESDVQLIWELCGGLGKPIRGQQNSGKQPKMIEKPYVETQN